MPEWSNGAVSKTVVLLAGTEGSNPSLSAKHPIPTPTRCGDFASNADAKLASRVRIGRKMQRTKCGGLGVLLLPPSGITKSSLWITEGILLGDHGGIPVVGRRYPGHSL